MKTIRITLVTSLAMLALACNEERRFIGDDGFYQLALTENTAPVYQDEDLVLYIVETRVEFPIIEPSEEALADLHSTVDEYEDLPFARLPWVMRGDIEIEIDFTLSNMDDARHEIAVTVNGINEFHEYLPGVSVIDDEVVADFAQWEKLYRLEPLERIHRTIREEDLDEVAVDLATVVNGAPNSQQIVYFENKSSTDPRSQEFIPEVVPGLIGVRIGLRSTQTARMLLEASVRVRDVEERLADEDDRLLKVEPEPFMPRAVEL